ncbi:MAG: SsrA-binding protein [Candidatus Komeilibacteria bacterium RIFCSPLOWO2_01_FULL_52_15]|uniref:SsrA-binding protein n=2 Tax=Candidatus Komeiliibacteriota TaxID=1817908 RepID=A0A1G2BQ67_9BACT|nr:MAG: SsrA-binding protein [Candidatus Komeilibacteria bacterium RIFCSPHIGHO2_01_FULL_52_14]OGY91335.1 MAG: SsrA-binding protein [Candidatus Komeilibacteria bacterium RIFCSPLOWO2_01_FULL_52_15]
MDLARNKKAYFNYQVLETFEAGIVLSGAEVKAAKEGRVTLDGAYVRIQGGEAWLINATIARYSKSGADQSNYVPDRNRKLLLTKREIEKIAGSLGQNGLTVVPLSVYSSRRLVKIKIALARGKRTIDKREAIKEKDYRRRLNARVRR